MLWLVGIGDGKLLIPVDFAKRGVTLPKPMLVADSWFSDSKLMRHVADAYRGTLLVQGKSHATFSLEDGLKVKGSDLVNTDKWAWTHSLHVPG